MKKYYKKGIAMLLAATMMSSMAVYGSDTDEAVTSEEGTKTTDISEITFPLEEPVTLTAYVYASNTGGNYMVDNYVTHWIEEQTNVKIDFVYDLDGDEAVTKLNLIMSDPDSMPDIFIRTAWSKNELALYGEQGLVLPLNDYLATAPNWLKANEESPMRESDITMTDGNIYCYGANAEAFHGIYQNRMWIYKPWVDEFNDGKIPETTDELYEYLVKIKNNDPNGNGIADEIPVSGFLGGWCTDPTVWFINSFLQCNNPLANTNTTVGQGWIVDDGQMKFQPVDDQYREAMRFLNKLYSEGLLDSQTFTQDMTQYHSLLNGEERLVAVHPGGMMWAENANLGVGPGGYQDWVAFAPVEGPEGVRLAATGINSFYSGCLGVVSKNCENPEIAIALFDWLMNEEPSMVSSYGPKGIAWDYVDGGTTVFGEEGAKWKTIVYDATAINWADYGYDPENLPFNPEHLDYPSDSLIANFNNAVFSAQLAENPEIELIPLLNKAAVEYSQYAADPESLVPDMAFSNEAAKKMADYRLTIDGYVSQATVQFITGAMDVDKDWDNYVETMYDMGLEDYIKTYQEAYDQYVASLNQ